MLRDNKGRFIKGIGGYEKTQFKIGNTIFLGKKHSQETKEKIRNKHKGKILSNEHKKRIGLSIKKHIKTHPEYIKNISNSMIGIKRSINTKEKISLGKKKNWENKDYREKSIKNMLKALIKRPTSYEQQIIKLCDKFNLPFKYVGNGQVIIAGLNPDFIETNGKKIVIETYCKYWHYKRNENYESDRQKIFSKYGYKIIFLNENELCCNDWEEKCLNKIRLI